MTDIERFLSKVDKNGPVPVGRPELGPCWLWTAGRQRDYGAFCIGGKSRRAHREGWKLLRGPIADDLTLDHLCRVRHCVNPDHLDPVPNKVNILRGVGTGAKNAVKQACKRGHPFTPENTYLVRGRWRECRTCIRDWHRCYGPTRNERRRRKRAADKAYIEPPATTGEAGKP